MRGSKRNVAAIGGAGGARTPRAVLLRAPDTGNCFVTRSILGASELSHEVSRSGGLSACRGLWRIVDLRVLAGKFGVTGRRVIRFLTIADLKPCC
jgi:hypothetical protein